MNIVLKRPVPDAIYFQTTPFTCGPSCLIMAMMLLDPDYQPSRVDEIQIWRESNMVYHGEPPAGCNAYGLAYAALKRGFDAEIYEYNARHMFKQTAATPDQATIQTAIEDYDRERAIELGCVIEEQKISRDLITGNLERERQLIALTADEPDGHWVMVHDLIEENIFVLDPYKAKKEEKHLPFMTDTGFNSLYYGDFKEWSEYGENKGTILISLGNK